MASSWVMSSLCPLKCQVSSADHLVRRGEPRSPLSLLGCCSLCDPRQAGKPLTCLGLNFPTHKLGLFPVTIHTLLA